MAQTSEPSSAASVRWTERSAPSATALCSARDGGLGAHRHGDDLVDLGVAALADLHRRLDAVGVERVEVLLAGAVEPLGARIDPLLDGGVRDLLDETANLQVRVLLGE